MKAIIVFTIAILLAPVSVMADMDGQRTALARLISELDALNRIIEVAEAQGEEGPVSLNFEVLRKDLNEIRSRIVSYLSHSNDMYKQLPPIEKEDDSLALIVESFSAGQAQ